MSTHPLQHALVKLAPILEKLEQWFWPEEHQIDTTKLIIYTCKPLPGNLKSSELKQWTDLQVKTQSPFISGGAYHYVSRHALHMWFAPTPLDGIPETARQSALPDGWHSVQGRQACYKQHWQRGVLMTCEVTTNSETAVPINLEGSSWAVSRKIDKAVKTPGNWLLFCALLVACTGLWYVSAAVTIHIQQQMAEQQAQTVTEQMGERVSQLDQLKNNQSLMSQLSSWTNEYSSFPETFAALAKSMNMQGSWKMNQVNWQNKTLTMEFIAEQVDIAQLVADLEANPAFIEVNIRPFVAGEGWIVEAKVGE
ncbi:hypothetical protein [Bowmanella pacifica]|uniref:Uncharacterized protein n=1 Tax=Bowmanella pacifica TaxID=502051 RepID=A0A918DFV2_9ALTE|nr:hypothetical protein [Bowmanella pacifica]GGO63618.1 hypothetical protein GCM10010982_01070 [Bowmanella pacifica]